MSDSTPPAASADDLLHDIVAASTTTQRSAFIDAVLPVLLGGLAAVVNRGGPGAQIAQDTLTKAAKDTRKWRT